MSECLPTVYLARHHKAAWSLNGLRTGLTDLPHTERGQRARQLGFMLSTAILCVPGYSPVIRLWNDTHHGSVDQERSLETQADRTRKRILR